MSDGKPVKISAVTASEVCAHINLEKSARRLLDDRMGPSEFVEALVSSRQYLAGIEFMAHALPAREAIWWGCLCLQYACGNELSASEKAACKAAVRWVLQPIERNRAVAKALAEAAGPASYVYSEVFDLKPTSGLYPGSGVLEYWSIGVLL